MNVVIIEDERLTANRLESLLHRYDPDIRVLASLPSVEQAVQWFQTPGQTRPDLVFMDIHLEDGLAFRIIEQVQLTTPIIFTTAYDEYMIQAFKVNSIDYLLKPVNYEELVAAIEKFKALRQQFVQPAAQVDLDALLTLLGRAAPGRGGPRQVGPRQVGPGNAPEGAYKDRFMITIGTKIRSISTAEIAYFYLEEKMAFLVTHDGLSLPVDYTLDKLVQLLDPKQFFRVSRQFLVALSAIQLIHTYSAGKLKLDLIPLPRYEVFVSGDRMADFKEWLGK